jgi:hypothetical protein
MPKEQLMLLFWHCCILHNQKKLTTECHTPTEVGVWCPIWLVVVENRGEGLWGAAWSCVLTWIQSVHSSSQISGNKDT